MLKNARHEIVAQELAKGRSATEALRAAGYSDPRNSTRLTKKDEIKRRVAELVEPAAKRAEVTVDTLAEELEASRLKALEARQISAAVSATMGKAKLFGLGKETRRIEGTLQTINIDPDDLAKLTDAELDALEAAMTMLSRIGVFGSDNDNETDEGAAA